MCERARLEEDLARAQKERGRHHTDLSADSVAPGAGGGKCRLLHTNQGSVGQGTARCQGANWIWQEAHVFMFFNLHLTSNILTNSWMVDLESTHWLVKWRGLAQNVVNNIPTRKYAPFGTGHWRISLAFRRLCSLTPSTVGLPWHKLSGVEPVHSS